MTNKEIIELVKGRTFTNMELIGLLSNIKEESAAQLKTIIKICKILGEPKRLDSVDEYLRIGTRNYFIGLPVADAYKEYCEWCKLCELPADSKKSFSSTLLHKFKLVSVTASVNGKPVRVYKEA